MLEKAIKNSEGKIKGFTYLPHSIKDFYQFLYTSNQDFEEKANNGDILLFKSDHSAASVQRFFTNSEYGTSTII